MSKINNTNQGFTLIEIAMVVVIFSVLMNLFGYALLAYQEQQKYKTTHMRMAAIEKAIDEFLDLNGRLPCVARVDRRPDQAGFGLESDNETANPNITICRFALPGTLPAFQQTAPPVGGAAPHWNRVGSVPVRSLNLPDEYLQDAWGSRFTYIVSERQASHDAVGVSMYRDNSGSINVVDRNGNSVIDQGNPEYGPGTRNFAEYVLISHGEDLKGGRSLSNGNVALVPCGTLAAEDQSENCVHTGANSNIVVSDVFADQNYDDIVIYKAGSNRSEILPSGAVIGFDQVVAGGAAPASNVAPPVGGFQCPPGWAAYDAARGRFIMGSTTNGLAVNYVRRSTNITVSNTNRNYQNLGQVGEDADATIPPFVTTLFCEKQ